MGAGCYDKKEEEMENKNQLKIGDVVKLKSGGISMTIAKIESGGANCCWSLKGEIKKTFIPLEALKLFQKKLKQSNN